MYHDVNQVKVLFEDVRDMYDEDTYQAISVLIDILKKLQSLAMERPAIIWVLYLRWEREFLRMTGRQ